MFSKLKNCLCKIVTKSQVVPKFSTNHSTLAEAAFGQIFLMNNGKKSLLNFFPIHFIGQLTSSTTEVDMKLSLTSKNDQAMINITGPDGKWFGVGLGAKTFTMSDQPYTIMVDGSGKVSELKLGDHSGGQTLAKSVTIVSNKVVNGRRTISLTRPLKVPYARYY